MSFHPRLARALAGASSASWCRRARNVRLGGRQGVGSGRGRNRSWPSRPPWVELGAVCDADEVAVPHGLKVQAPEPDFESSWEGIRAAHGVPLGPVLGADHHRDGWWKADLQHAVPYLVRQLSVRKVVPTLTSKSAEIYLSMAGAKQLVTRGLSWFRPRPYVQQWCARDTVLCCTVMLAEGSYNRGGRGGRASRSVRYD
jgi:hypothetical protein